MAKELTPQQELFCQKYIECKGNASEAYRQSYNPSDPGADWVKIEACRMLQDPNISLTIEALQAEQRERNKVTLDSLTAEYEEIKRLAMMKEELSAAVAALNGKAKIHGFDKVKIEGDLKMVRIKDLTGKK